jgi:heptosyltransferase I
MGDILHALPAITALRLAHPTWRIGWAVEPRWRGLLSAEAPAVVGSEELMLDRGDERPVVDQLHWVPAKAWGKKPLSRATLDGVRALRAELRAADYDAVLDMQGSIRSAVIARLAGCRRVVGAEEPWERPARWLYTERVETPGKHVVEQGVELARAVAGDLLMPTLPLFPVDGAAERWCAALPSRIRRVDPEKPLVLMYPGAGWGAKRWPAERFGVVAEALSEMGATVLVNSGPGEEHLAAAVVSAAHGRAVAVECSLEQLLALTRRAVLAIGGDTGPMHLACALGKPVVGIYGPTDPGRNGPFGAPFLVLRNPESRRDHTRRLQPEAGLLTIDPDKVIEAAMELAGPKLSRTGTDPWPGAWPDWEPDWERDWAPERISERAGVTDVEVDKG